MKTMHKVLIVEDELLARKRLRRLLQNYDDQIEIIGEATNGKEGLEMIDALQPEFVFLDIQMPILNGFDMLMKLSHQPYIIFTTAFDEYAIKAFEKNSIDYLLKPIRPERLAVTMEKIAKLTSETKSDPFDQVKLEMLMNHLQPAKTMRSITVHLGDKINIVSLEDIIFLQAEDKYVALHTKDGKKHLITQSLSQLEKKLPDTFFRINRSSIINENEIHEIRKSFNGKLDFEMKDKENTKITSGSSYNTTVKERLKF